MNNKKTGTSMGGTIEYTRTKKKQQFINKIDTVKKKSAKVCIGCEHNKEGYCNKFKGWCGKKNYICNGQSISYQDKLQQDKFEYKLKKETQRKQRLEEQKKKKKVKIKAKKKANKSINKAGKSELGQAIKPSFDTTKLTIRKYL